MNAALALGEPARPLPVAERLRRNGLEPSVRISVPPEHRKVCRRCAAVQEIAEWLDKLGMSEYAQRFAENGIRYRCASPSDRSRPEGHWRPAWASAANAGGPSGASWRAITSAENGHRGGEGPLERSSGSTDWRPVADCYQEWRTPDCFARSFDSKPAPAPSGVAMPRNRRPSRSAPVMIRLCGPQTNIRSLSMTSSSGRSGEAFETPGSPRRALSADRE